MERLEARTLLAGNVTAQFLNQNAFFSGDAADNSVQILVENGNVVARGVNTTINGSTDDIVLATGTSTLPRNLTAWLGDGNDTFVVNGVTIGRNVAVNAGRGNDRIGIIGSSVIGHNLAISGQSGDDTISLQDSTVGRTTHIAGGPGNDLLIVSQATIGRNLWISGGSGNDDIVVDGSRIGQDTRIAGWGGDDDIVIRNSELVDDLSISGHGGNDIIMFDSSTVGDKSRMHTGFGHDNIMIQGTSRFFDRLRTIGGPGADNLEAASSVVFDGLKRRSFSSAIVDPALIAARVTDPVTGAIAAAERAIGDFDPQLELTIDNASVSEGAGDGAATLTVTRSADTSEALEVTLTSSDEAKLVLQASTVTIPAGQASATILVNPLDNTVIDSDVIVTVTATAAGVKSSSIDVTVENDDFETLTVSASVSEILEDTGSATTTGVANTFAVTVSRTGDASNVQIVNLQASLDGTYDLPASVTIPAGDASFTFDVQTVVDTQVEDDLAVALTASAAGFISGTTSVTILDNDSPHLTVTFSAPTITEVGTNSDVGVTVTRNTDTTDALTVTLTSQDVDSLTFSGGLTIAVEIPAGAAFATVSATGVAEDLDDGDTQIAVTASAAGFASGSQTIVALDDDDPTLTIVLPNTVSEADGTGAVSATISRNSIDVSADLQITINTTGDARFAGPASATIPAGQSSVNVAFDTIDNNIVDDPADGTAAVSVTSAGFTEGTATVIVTNDDVATINLSPSSLSVSEDAGVGGLSVTLSRTVSSIAETITLAYSNTALVSGPTTVEFLVGESTKDVFLDVIDNGLFAPNSPVTLTAMATGHADVSTSIGVINDEILSVTMDTSTNTTVQSVGTLITKEAAFRVTGQTAPGATVQIDTNGDAAFDEGSATADGSGNYAFDVTLEHDDANDGRNRVQVRSLIVLESVDALSEAVNVHLAVGSVVRFETNQDLNADTVSDFYDVEMLDADAPNTVLNFMSYVNDGSYANMFAHRSPANFVVQAGGFKVDNSVVSAVATKPAIANEFSASNSNERGTLSMAQLDKQPNSGTSGWFVSTGSNSFLDNDLHTVFGRVIGDGINVVDAINDLPIYDLNFPLNQGEFGALSKTPLARSPLSPLSGSVALTADSATLTGTNTLFTTELEVGNLVQIGGTQLTVVSITSDTEIEVDVQASANQGGLSISLYTIPSDDDFIIFTNIGEILDSI